MANFKEIINSKEYFKHNNEERMLGVTVHLTDNDEFLCIMQETIPSENYRVCTQIIDIKKTYREVRDWYLLVQWYTNGNQYDNSEYKE